MAIFHSYIFNYQRVYLQMAKITIDHDTFYVNQSSGLVHISEAALVLAAFSG